MSTGRGLVLQRAEVAAHGGTPGTRKKFSYSHNGQWLFKRCLGVCISDKNQSIFPAVQLLGQLAGS